MKKPYLKTALHIFILNIAGLHLLQAQNTGIIEGYVYDAVTEQPLPLASVMVEGTQKGTSTDTSGFFRLENITPKTYNLKASFVGYQEQVKYKVVVRSGVAARVNFYLSENTNTLSDVTVTANPFKREKESPLSIQKLSAEEVATYPGGNNDIAKVVQSLPGVAGSIGGFRNDVIIRGGAPNENVYYLDGVEIPNINHFATQGSAGGPVGLLNVSFFEGVTLNTSAFPARYDNALSGVLQFDQRDGNNREFQTNLRLSASEAAATVEGPLFKKKDQETSRTSFIASVRRSYLQFLFELIDLPFLPDYWDYQYKFTYKVNRFDEITFTGIGSLDNFSINVPDEFTPDQQATLDQVPIINQWTTTAGATWKRRFTDYSGFMTTTLSTNVLNNNLRRYRNNETEEGLFFSNNSREWETKLRYRYNKFWKQWKVETGFSTQWAQYDNTTRDVVNSFDFNTDLGFLRYGFFGQASYDFSGVPLTLSGGVRADGNTFTERGNNILRTLSPRIAASYTLDKEERWTVNASLGRYYKIPPYTILGFKQGGTFVNENADYTESDHAVLGLEYLLTESSRLSVEGFYKHYRDYPVSLTDSVSLANLGADFSVLGNEPVQTIGTGRSYGVEILYQQKFTGNWYAILAITLYRSEFTAFDENDFKPSSWDNGQLITFTGGYRFGKNWEISARNRFLGPTPYAPVDQAATLANYPDIIYNYNLQGSRELDPFNQLDIRIDKKWNFRNWTLDLFLDVQNVLGSEIPALPTYGLSRTNSGGIVQPRQLVRVEEVDNSSVLPSIGVVIDF